MVPRELSSPLDHVTPNSVAVDFGFSTWDAAWTDASGQLHTSHVRPPTSGDTPILDLAFSHIPHIGDIPLDSLAITGGRSADAPDEFLGKPVIKVNEVAAIAEGGFVCATRCNAPTERGVVTLSCGTGTACVFRTPDGQHIHLGGTGVGGGTLRGLGELLARTNDAQALIDMADCGDRSKVDLRICDIVAEPIGALPRDATAANFGKLAGDAQKQDGVAALINMISEVLYVVGASLAVRQNASTLALIGRMSTIPLVRKRFGAALKLIKASPALVFDDFAPSATAIGALAYAAKTKV